MDIVSIQYEFGIFGGPAGSHLLVLLRELKAPVTVLLKPNADEHAVMEELIAYRKQQNLHFPRQNLHLL